MYSDVWLSMKWLQLSCNKGSTTCDVYQATTGGTSLVGIGPIQAVCPPQVTTGMGNICAACEACPGYTCYLIGLYSGSDVEAFACGTSSPPSPTPSSGCFSSKSLAQVGLQLDCCRHFQAEGSHILTIWHACKPAFAAGCQW